MHVRPRHLCVYVAVYSLWHSFSLSYTFYFKYHDRFARPSQTCLLREIVNKPIISDYYLERIFIRICHIVVTQ